LGGQPTALAFTGLGEELWRWSDPAIVERWSSACPPAVSDEGRVLFFGESEVVALRRGGVQWWGRVPGRGTLRGAILSDGASLVVRGSVLHHFDPSGNAVFEVDLKEDVIAGPVVTPNGWVNLATGSGLLGVC
jgi:hypothetical protein